MTVDRFAEVADAVLERVEPDDAERDRLDSVVGTLIDRTADALSDLQVDAEPAHVGSTARDTWIAGDRDVDVFVRFPTALSREELEDYGL
ncbi:MAG TPA: nucleotidyltransferase domain-containing protein, partial [Halobacteriales archaeon]|nr:nucleotidyltransferase domain-containing protein [Halobacteriales archaeon]